MDYNRIWEEVKKDARITQDLVKKLLIDNTEEAKNILRYCYKNASPMWRQSYSSLENL